MSGKFYTKLLIEDICFYCGQKDVKKLRNVLKEDSDYISSTKADRCKAIEKKLDNMCQEVDENVVKFNREGKD
ncbi:hypothetical protein C2G38_2172670 [Gigaspora rosea]|uniref:Uncharacterized protein n=1 Tax=Gigaspora rosea TaxID=44941 RepID=A0A397VM68_9GLOM|nr:hypothetical protein C2G38_2172670 [Gigaspora rosea]